MRPGALAAGGGRGQQLSREKIRELIEEMKKRHPPAPAPQDAAPAQGQGPLKPPEDAPAPAPSGAP